jgi:uncharacterized protein (DUF305 family)
MVRHRSRTAALALLAVAALGGCSESTGALDPEVRHLQPGAPGEPNTVLTEAPPEDVQLASPFSEADVAFLEDMRVHHRQALRMTALVPDRTEREDLKLFVERMDISQAGELERLDSMLEQHHAVVERHGGAPPGHSGHSADGDHSDMPGMLTGPELVELEASSGEQFVRLFLQGMTRHHQGALAMVEQLLATEGAAADPRLFQFAQHVDSDQRIELSRMERMWAELDSTAR